MEGSRIGVCVVKNRGGPANAAGNLVVYLDVDLSKMEIKDPEYGNQGPMPV
jgi:hypothetical protein